MSGVGKAIGGMVKTVAPIAAPIIGSAVGGPMGGMIGGQIGSAIGGQEGGGGKGGAPQGGVGMPQGGLMTPPYFPSGGMAPAPAPFGGYTPYPSGPFAGGTFGGIGGILGHNLSQADARAELARHLAAMREDYQGRGDIDFDAYRRRSEYDADLGQRMFDIGFGNEARVWDRDWARRGLMDDRSFGNWDRGIGRLGDVQRTIAGGGKGGV